MHADYFETRFIGANPGKDWPDHFAIITAFSTTGETWTTQQNEAADEALRRQLEAEGVWFRRVTGYSPATGHSEPGWAAQLPLDRACDIGLQFKQDAIYFVEQAKLFVSFCDDRRDLEPVASFSDRLDDSV